MVVIGRNFGLTRFKHMLKRCILGENLLDEGSS
jgi:hypothetical protein